MNVLGVMVDAADYECVTARVLDAARDRRPLSCSALAVHGVTEGVRDAEYRHRLNSLDIVTADGQPVRWALNWLHSAGLRERVYGPELMLRICAGARDAGLPIYLFGGHEDTQGSLADRLRAAFPGLEVSGEPSSFRTLSPAERDALMTRIRDSGAAITFVGLGCPRQEVFAYECRDDLGMPVIAVGAAFDYHAGSVTEPPALVQRIGLQWAYRLIQQPRRLWRRYLIRNPLYLLLLGLQRTGLWRPDAGGPEPKRRLMYG